MTDQDKIKALAFEGFIRGWRWDTWQGKEICLPGRFDAIEIANQWKDSLYTDKWDRESREWIDKESIYSHGDNGFCKLVAGPLLIQCLKKHPKIAKKIIQKINKIYNILHSHLEWWTEDYLLN